MWLMKLFRKKVKENKPMKWGAVAALGATIAVNAYANIAKLGGFNTGEISDKYPNLFTPTGLTFSIWSVIYLLLVIYAIYQFAAIRVRAKSTVDEAVFQQITPLFILSCVANIAWMVTWHMQAVWLSMICMLALLMSLILIVRLLYRTIRYAYPLQKDYCYLKLPFIVYLGWISVATIANTYALAVSLGWNASGTSAGVWLALGLVVGAFVGVVAMWRMRDPAYGVVFVWAYGGILIKHLSEDGFNGAYPSAIALLTVLIAVLASAVLGVAVLSSMKQK